MAKGLGVMGLPNTGKSFSRTFITNGEKCFVISPSNKFHYLTDSTGKVVKPFDFTSDIGSLRDISKKNNISIHDVVKQCVIKAPPGLKPSGNHVIVQDVEYLPYYIKFIDMYMPEIKVVFQADFTHWVSRVIADANFIKRKQGGEAFQRFWELAASLLNNVFLAIDDAKRQDLIVATEFHCQTAESDENDLFYDIFLPAGKMLNNSFKPKSYFDFMIFTDVAPYDEAQAADKDYEGSRYQFVVTRQEPFDARMANLFPEANKGRIPNNMELVLNRMRAFLGMDEI